MEALPTFGKWLRGQKDREGPIGDIARDVISDSCARRLRNYFTIREHITTGHTPCSDALDALKAAYMEWRAIATFQGK